MRKDARNIERESADLGLRLVEPLEEGQEQTAVEKQFVNFIFLRVDSAWRQLDPTAKAALKGEFCSVFESFHNDFILRSYSLVGFDSKADLMLWRVGRSLDRVQEMTSKLFRTDIGGYLETVDNYLAVTKKMMFVNCPSTDRLQVEAGTAKYHFLYPCAKHKDWSELSPEERDAMIEENFMVGRKFPNIKIHLTHAFGFNDLEYLVSFETDEPRDFLALAEELRQTPASKLTLRGMPIYTCRKRSLADCLDALG